MVALAILYCPAVNDMMLGWKSEEGLLWSEDLKKFGVEIFEIRRQYCYIKFCIRCPAGPGNPMVTQVNASEKKKKTVRMVLYGSAVRRRNVPSC